MSKLVGKLCLLGLALAAFVALPAVTQATPLRVSPLLCKHEKCGGSAGAWEQAENDAQNKWAGREFFSPEARTERCEGPFENVKGKTQYACYGEIVGNVGINATWQINLDPYGKITYEHIS